MLGVFPGKLQIEIFAIVGGLNRYRDAAALTWNKLIELFGHTKGAFTGAIAERVGKFEVANGGTLFLDEIGELPLSVQAKLLRAIQNGDIQRVGSDQAIKVDVRIVAATNRDLQHEVSTGRFRADLYHRLSVYPIQVPPLRERGRDILLLTGYLLEKNQRRLGVQGLRLSSSAKQVLLDYEWPGNVRELEHLLSRAALKAIAQQGRDARTVTLDAAYLDIRREAASTNDLPSSTTNNTPMPSHAVASQEHRLQLKEALDHYQITLINAALERNKGNRSAAAKELGLNRSNFHRLTKRLAII